MYKKEDYKKLCSIKSTKQFESKRKNVDPFDKFYKKVLKNVKISENASVSSIIVTENLYRKLEKIVDKWAKEAYNLKNKEHRERQTAFYMLDRSPAIFYNGKPEWAKDIEVYIKIEALK